MSATTTTMDGHHHGNHVPVAHHHNVMRRYHKKTAKPRKDYHFKIYRNPLENFEALSEGAKKKTHMNFPVLFLLGVLGGIYVGFGGMLSLTMAGGLDPAWAARFPSLQRALIGLTFPSALTYIIIAGGELFTSNIMYTTLGLLRRNVNPLKSIAVCASAFISNFLGCVLVAGFSVHLAGFLTTDPYKTYLLNTVHHKVQEPSFGLLLLKAIPANILVNIGVIMASAAEDIIGKIVGGYLPIMTFAIIGMEHCIANDFYIHAATFIEGGFPYGTWLWKTLIAVTLGNIIGGMFVAFCYWYAYLAEHQLGKEHRFLSFKFCCQPETIKEVDADIESGTGHRNLAYHSMPSVGSSADVIHPL